MRCSPVGWALRYIPGLAIGAGAGGGGGFPWPTKGTICPPGGGGGAAVVPGIPDA